MTTPSAGATGQRSRRIARRREELAAAVDRGGERLPAGVRETVRSSLDSVGERLELGVDHTVVALVGGTGSGKSSLFNALSGLRFADVGARRPTTSAVTACTWGSAARLLDWLGVAPDRRIERESALDGESQADLRGLVLLDLPDHDSVASEHRAVVDRLLPMVDLLVWVVDPQKYADDALHSGYLRHLGGHEGSMLVVLNQIDTVPVSEQGALLHDVARLLREDGLSDVPVHSLSALTGDGVPVLRGALARAVAGRGQAELRAEAELTDAAAALATAVGDGEPRNLPRDATVEHLLAALGVSAAADALRHGEPVTVGPAQPERVGEVRRGWLEAVTTGLPDRWRTAVEETIRDEKSLTASVDAAAGAVRPAPADPRASGAWRTASWVLAVVGVVLLGVTIGTWIGSGGFAAAVGLLAAGTLAAAAAAATAALQSRRAAAADRERRAQALVVSARSAVAEVVDDALVGPSRAVLVDHRAVRLVGVGPREDVASDPPTASSTGTDDRSSSAA
jgi:GTP-binding protein EngB required for normal cell division